MKKKKAIRMKKVYYADGHVGYRPVLSRRQYLQNLKRQKKSA